MLPYSVGNRVSQGGGRETNISEGEDVVSGGIITTRRVACVHHKRDDSRI